MTDLIDPPPEDGETENAVSEVQTVEDRETARPAIVKRRRGTSRVTTAIAALLLAGIGGTLLYNFSGATPLERSHVSRVPPTIDGTPGGVELAASPYYQETVMSANRKGAEAAAQTPGKSFIATPDQPVEDNPMPVQVAQMPTLAPPNEEPKAAPKPEPKIVYRDRIIEKRVEVPVAPAQPDWSRIRSMADGMDKQARDIAASAAPPGTEHEILVKQELYEAPDGRPIGVQVGRSRQQQQNTGQAPAVMAPLKSTFPADLMTTSPYYSGHLEYEPKLPVDVGRKLGSGVEIFNGDYFAAAGDINMAVVLNGSDTDTPGPIVAKLLRGPLKGARLIGTFAPNRETTAMIVTFSRVILPDGTNIDASAYAIDAATASLPVKSDYSGRYLQRYGPKLAGAFLKGLGTALGNTGSSVALTGNAAIVTSREQTTKEAIYSGVGEVGEQLSDEISDLGPQGPIVTLKPGKLIGVLFMENVARI